MRALLICVLLVPGALLAQTVEGTVTATGGTALPGVKVTLMKAGGQNEVTGYTATTNDAGAFQIGDVKAGAYLINLTREGYLGPSPGVPGNRTFVVANGVPTKRLHLEMMAEGKVSGLVLDGRGSPVPGAKVVLAVPNSTFESQTTDRDGAFLFDDVRPATYSLVAVAPAAWKAPDPVDGLEFAWVPTFLGGVSFREGAARLVVRPGSELPGQKLKLLAAPAHKLRGRVVDMSGDPVAGLKVELWDREGLAEGRSVASKTDGSFEFAVPEGVWRLSARSVSGVDKLSGSHTLLLGSKDVDDVIVRLTPPFTARGSVRFDPPQAGQSPRVILLPEGGNEFPLAGVDEKGQFAAPGLYAGVYNLTMIPANQPGYYLDTVRLGDREVLSRGMELVSGETPISIVFKAGGGTVTGVVSECGAGSVLLVPQEKAIRRQGLVRVVRCGENDRFEIPSVRPGEYYAFAFAAGSSPLVPPYDLDQEYVNQAVRVSVEDRGTSKVELKVIASRWK